MLYPNHAESLRKRSIPEHIAERSAISSATAGEVADVLGLCSAEFAGILIPYFGADGQPLLGDDGLEIVRVRMDSGEPKYRSRGSAGYSVYLTPKLREHLSSPSPEEGTAPLKDGDAIGDNDIVLITEGEFKALSADHNLAMPSIGLAGVDMYRDPARDKTEPTSASTPLHPHLVAALSRARGVVVVADSDAAENPRVRGAMRNLKEAISGQIGLPCAYVEVPGKKRGRGRPKKDEAGMGGEAVEKIGLDDWIASVGAAGVDSVRAFLKKSFRDEVKRLDALESGGYLPLGYTIDENTGSGSYFVYSVEKSAIVRVGSSEITNVNTLIHTCGLAWLQARYLKELKGGGTTIDNLTAGGDLAAACNAAGHWNDERRVSGGLWPIPGDPSAIVINSASGLWTSDGREISPVNGDAGGRLVYMSTIDLGVTPQTPMATAQDGAEVYEALKSWTWVDERDAGAALGWLAAAFLCGALDVRPMLYVSGERGGGKSTMLSFMRSLLGPLALRKFEGTSLTEPGLRRALGRTSLVTFVDEAESTDNPQRLKEVIAYIRSSYAGGETTKASGSGSGVDVYTVRTMAALGAISPLRLDDSEQSRFIRLELLPRGIKKGISAPPPSHELVINPAAARAMSDKLAARMIRSWPRFRAALEIAKSILKREDGSDDRYRETMGTIIAAGWVMLHDGMPSEGSILEHMGTLDIATQRERIVETRTDATPLEWLLDKIVPVDVMGRTVRLTVRELIVAAGDEVGSRGAEHAPNTTALGRFGLRVGKDPETGEHKLYVDPGRGELKALFDQSRWAIQVLEDAFKTRVPSCSRKREDFAMLIGGKRLKPLSMGLDGLIAFDQEDDAPSERRSSATSEAINRVYSH